MPKNQNIEYPQGYPQPVV